MKIKPMLGEFPLNGIECIESSESRALVEHRVPGLAGNYFQDMGSVPNTIVIAGTKSGDEARDNFLTGIREIFNKGEPTTFVADINTATDITDVVIEDLDVAEIGGSPDSFRYLIKVRKYTKPPEPPAPRLLDAGILEDALNLVEGAMNTLDALGSIPNLGDPTGPVRQALDGIKAASGGLDRTVNDLRDLFGEGATEGPASVPEAAEIGPAEPVPQAEELRIDPADPRVDRATGSTLQSMLESPETAGTAARLIRGVQDGTLAGVLGDDSDVAQQLAAAHGTEPSSLVPDGQDAALVLDAASPLKAPPTILLRSGVRDDPAQLGAALEAVGRTFELFQRGELGPCDSTPSAIQVPNLVPPSFCRVPVAVSPAGEGLEGKPEVIDPSAPDLQIDPTDPTIDVGAKFALKRMLKDPAMAVDAARLILGLKGQTLARTPGKPLAGIFGDDLGAAVKVAHAHGTERWLLIPKGEDAALVLDATAPLDAPPTVIFRGDTPDIRDIPARIDPALQKVSRTFKLWQRRLLGPCASSPSSIPVANLVPTTFCRLPAKTLVRIELEKFDGSSMADELYELEVEGILVSAPGAKTDGKGRIEEVVPEDAENGVLFMEDNVWEIKLINFFLLVDPAPDRIVKGVQQRLTNMAFYAGEIHGDLDPDTKLALTSFQADFGLETSGELDEPTLGKLREVFPL